MPISKDAIGTGTNIVNDENDENFLTVFHFLGDQHLLSDISSIQKEVDHRF